MDRVGYYYYFLGCEGAGQEQEEEEEKKKKNKGLNRTRWTTSIYADFSGSKRECCWRCSLIGVCVCVCVSKA